MSALEVLLGEPRSSLKLPDGRSWQLYPLRLSDLARLQKQLGIGGNAWEKPEIAEKFYELETIGFILWLALRRNADAAQLTPEAVLELFGMEDLDALKAAVEAVLTASGLMRKNVTGAAGQGAAALSNGPGSSLSA